MPESTLRRDMTLGTVDDQRQALVDAIVAACLKFYEDTGIVAHVQMHTQERDGEPPEVRVSTRLMLGE